MPPVAHPCNVPTVHPIMVREPDRFLRRKRRPIKARPLHPGGSMIEHRTYLEISID